MNHHRLHWAEPISIKTAALGVYQDITNTEDAAWWLLREWPSRDSERYWDAMEACLDALEGICTHQEARDAFIAAATEAKLFVRH